MAKKLKYIQIQPDRDFLNGDFLMLSPALRGIYLTVKLYLYTNNGVCELDYCKLATITNCKNFKKYFPQVEHLFTVNNGKIKHKDVTADLKQARKCMKVRRIAGLKGAQKRWQSHSGRNGDAINLPMAKNGKVNETETEKESKVKTNSSTIPDFPSGSSSISSRCDFGNDSPLVMQVKFYDLATELIVPVGASDRTSLKNIASWLKEQAEKTGDKAVFSKAWRLAQESKRNGRKPMAMLNSLMKTELGYRKLPKEML